MEQIKAPIAGQKNDAGNSRNSARMSLKDIAQKIHEAEAQTSTIEPKEARRFSILLNLRLRYAEKTKNSEAECEINKLKVALDRICAKHAALKTNKSRGHHDFRDRSCIWVWRLLREKPLKEINKGDRRLLALILGKRLEEKKLELEELKRKQKISARYGDDIRIVEAKITRLLAAIKRLETFERTGKDIEDLPKNGFRRKPLVEKPVVDYESMVQDGPDGTWWDTSDCYSSGLHR